MTFKEIVNESILPIGDAIVYILYALAFFLFLFGILKFFFARGEKAREDGKKFMLWGLVGLVVLFIVWGLVNILLSVLRSWA